MVEVTKEQQNKFPSANVFKKMAEMDLKRINKQKTEKSPKKGGKGQGSSPSPVKLETQKTVIEDGPRYTNLIGSMADPSFSKDASKSPGKSGGLQSLVQAIKSKSGGKTQQKFDSVRDMSARQENLDEAQIKKIYLDNAIEWTEINSPVCVPPYTIDIDDGKEQTGSVLPIQLLYYAIEISKKKLQAREADMGKQSPELEKKKSKKDKSKK